MQKTFLILFLSIALSPIFVYADEDAVSISAEVLPVAGGQASPGISVFALPTSVSTPSIPENPETQHVDAGGNATGGGLFAHWKKYVPFFEKVSTIKQETSWSGIDGTKGLLQSVHIEPPTAKETGVVSLVSIVVLVVVSVLRRLLLYLAGLF